MTKDVGGSTPEAELAALKGPAPRAAPIGLPEYEARLEKARGLMAGLGADALLIGAGASLRYFTGVGWGATERLVALVLPRRGRPVMICPAFELGSLEASLLIDADIRLWEEDEDPYALAAQAAREAGDALALDPGVTFLVFNGLRGADPDLHILDGAAVVNGCRQVKSAAELALMTEAKQMTLQAHRAAARMLAPGVCRQRGETVPRHRAPGPGRR